MYGGQDLPSSGFAQPHPTQMSPEEVFAAFFRQFSEDSCNIFSILFLLVAHQTGFPESPFHFQFSSGPFPFQGNFFGQHNLFQSHPFFAQHGPFRRRHHHTNDAQHSPEDEVEELVQRIRDMARFIFFLLLSLFLSYIWP